MRAQLILLGLLLTGSFTLFGCGGGGGGGDTPIEVVPSVEGTWAYTVDGQPSGVQIIRQNGANFTLGGGCEYGTGGRLLTITENAVQSTWTYPMNGLTETATMSGTISADKKVISGTWMNSEGGSGTWELMKISTSTVSPSSGSLTINGTFDGNPVTVVAAPVCAEKDYRSLDGPILDDIEINTMGVANPLGGIDWWGIEFETPEMLASGAAFDIQSSSFKIDFQSSIIEKKFLEQGIILSELAASTGLVTIQTYDGNVIKGTFDIQSQLYDLNGTFDVTLEP